MEERTEWPARAPLLTAIGAIAGLGYNWLVSIGDYRWTDDPLRLALGALLLGTAIPFAFVIERRRIAWATYFAAASGLVIGLVTWWTGGLGAGIGTEPWHLVCALLAVAIAAPLFQVARDEETWRFPYRAVHSHAWTNVVLWFAACAFVLVTFLLAYLLSSLFNLIGIDALQTLLRKSWFDCALAGAAFGGAVGLLRERDRVVVTLQRVVTAVSSVLAPILALGLLLFLVILPFKGVELLWQATKYTTPILLSCIVWAMILANAVLGDSREEEARSPILRWGAMGLGVAMLPLALIAAVSTAKRIHQYGLTPDRLWAVTFVAIATAYALAYLTALVRKRAAWGEGVRPANLKLAFAICAVALLLATPLAAFGLLSVHDQMARIRDGRTPPDRIDYRALAFDMGKAGRRGLEALRSGGATADIRKRASKALAARSSWDVDNPMARPKPALLLAKTQVFPADATVPPQLWAGIPNYNPCANTNRNTQCVIRLWDDRGMAAIIAFTCWPRTCGVQTLLVYRHADGSWGTGRTNAEDQVRAVMGADLPKTDPEVKRQWAAVRRGDITIRPVTKDQLFLGNEQTGDVVEPMMPAAKP